MNIRYLPILGYSPRMHVCAVLAKDTFVNTFNNTRNQWRSQKPILAVEGGGALVYCISSVKQDVAKNADYECDSYSVRLKLLIKKRA